MENCLTKMPREPSAPHSTFLISMMKTIFGWLYGLGTDDGSGVFNAPDAATALRNPYERIVDAIARRDPDGALEYMNVRPAGIREPTGARRT